MAKKILVTGAGGYIGSVSTYTLLQNGYEVIALDNFSRGYKKPLEILQKKYGKNKLRIYQKDLLDNLDSLFKKEKDIHAVIHYAALCLVKESMSKPQKYFTNNVCGTQNLLSTMLKFDIKNLVFSSTCAVYGDAEYVLIDENHPTNPSQPYGESKLISENIIRWYGMLLGLNYVILRYFNICGASDDSIIGDSKNPSELLMQNAVRGALGIEPFSLTCGTVNTPDKTPIRDYINVVDLNEAHLKALDYLLKGGRSEIINLGTGTGNSVLEIVKKVQDVTGVKFDIRKSDPRPGEYAKAIASIGKAEKILNWKPKRSIEDSVRSLIKWYTTNPQGWN